MFFKRLFQCVRYSISLYADCAVIIRAVGTVGAGGTIGPPQILADTLTLLESRGNLRPPHYYLSYPPPLDFQTFLWPFLCVAESCKVTLTSNMILVGKKMQLYRILQGKTTFNLFGTSKNETTN